MHDCQFGKGDSQDNLPVLPEELARSFGGCRVAVAQAARLRFLAGATFFSFHEK